MKNTKRQAFTIVELVIVIAVIAILSAVLIPTFGAIIKDANIAADQSAAATLTTELHVYLKGETIDSEEELMDALDKSGVGVKLVPKALAHGYHFWFDMKTQMIVANTAEEIAEMGKDATPATPVEGEGEGAMLTSAVLTAETTKTYPLSMRHVYGNGYILADSASVFNQMFGSFDDITADTYAGYIKHLSTINNDSFYYGIAEEVLKTIKTTVIVNEHGAFIYNGTKTTDENDLGYYFAPGLKVISADRYSYTSGDAIDETNPEKLPTPTSGSIDLPASVLLVEEDALDFGDENTVVINTTHADENALAGVFAPKSTDATIKDTDENTYKVTIGDSKDGISNSDILVAASDSAWKADLFYRLPFEDFGFAFECVDGEKTDEVPISYDKDTNTLYISYLQNDNIRLIAKDAASSATSTAIEGWNLTAIVDGGIKISDDGVLTFDGDIITDADNNGKSSHQATIIMEAYNIYGKLLTGKSLNVEVRIAKEANVTIAGNTVHLSNGGEQQITYLASQGDITTAVSNTNIVWKATNVGDTICSITGVGNLAFEQNGTTSGTITLDTKEETIGNKTVTVLADTTTVYVTLDGYVKTKLTIKVNDTDRSDFDVNYHHSSDFSKQEFDAKDEDKQDKSAYYIGSENSILLSDIFNIKDGKTPFANSGKATITVYSQTEGRTGFYNVNEINNRLSVDNISATYSKTVLGANNTSTVESSNSPLTVSSLAEWESASIKFNTLGGYDRNDDIDIVIEIAPASGYAMYAYVTVVDGAINIVKGNDIDDINNALTAEKDVVLQSDLTITSGMIDVGAQILYGNGYIIDATDYIGAATIYSKDTGYECTTCGELVDCQAYCTMCEAHILNHTHYYCSKCDEIEGNDGTVERDTSKKYYCLDCGEHVDKKTAPLKGYSYHGTLKVNECGKNNIVEHETPTNKVVTTHSVGTEAKEKINSSYINTPNAYSVFTVSSGTIDNIYIDGPVLTAVQYEKSTTTYTSYNSTTGNNDNVTGLVDNYVAGIVTTGNATISNSYICGFRSPVQITGTTSTNAKLDNVTLEGGNLCNLSISSGNATLNNLTTIQKPLLVKDAILATNKEYAFGAGILVEEENALASNIIVTGTFMQYNWVNQDNSGKLPTIYPAEIKLPLGSIAYLGYTASGAVARADELFTTYSGTKYFNTGIIYIATENNGSNNVLEEEDITGNVNYVGASNGIKMTNIEIDIEDLQTKASSLWETMVGILKLAGTDLSDFNVVTSVYTYANNITPPVVPGSEYSGYYTQRDYSSYTHHSPLD